MYCVSATLIRNEHKKPKISRHPRWNRFTTIITVLRLMIWGLN